MTLKTISKRTRYISIIVILGIGLSVIGTGVYWRRVYSQPANVFNRMLNNALSTASVSKNSLADGEGQTISQVTDIFLNADPRVHGLVDITQTGEDRSEVKRETLTTNSDSYIRLVSIETTQKNSAGKPFDFSTITGIWGQTPADESNNSSSQLFGQNVAVPFANLSRSQRQKLVNQIKNDGVYEIDNQKTKQLSQNGRPVIEYHINVKPDSFIKMMKTLGSIVGVKSYDQVSSEDYKNLPKAKFVFTVDVLSGDLIKVDYGNKQIENYSGHGIRTLPTNPKNAVTMAELQKRLQNLQQ